MKAYPSQQEVKELLEYDPVTGELRWLPRPNTSGPNKCFNRKFAGKVAGTVRKSKVDNDSVLVRIYKKTYHASHLIYVWMGVPRPEVIGFRDRDPLNLKWNNLISTDLKSVAKKRKEARISKTGVKHIYLQDGKFRVRFQKGNRKVNIGTFNTIEQAKEALKGII
jgi:hypothetical protein